MGDLLLLAAAVCSLGYAKERARVCMELIIPRWVVKESTRAFLRELRAVAYFRWLNIKAEWRGSGECQ